MIKLKASLREEEQDEEETLGAPGQKNHSVLKFPLKDKGRTAQVITIWRGTECKCIIYTRCQMIQETTEEVTDMKDKKLCLAE